MPFAPFACTVDSVEDLTPNMRRIRFVGEDLHLVGMERPWLDQRIKVIVPLNLQQPQLPDLDPENWWASWRATDARAIAACRTYTVRRWDRDFIDIDFAMHEGQLGPVARWAQQASTGQRIILILPTGGERRGIEYAPANAKRIILVGDETALPAIASILESTEHPDVHAFIEIPTPEDRQEFTSTASIQWCPRGERPHGVGLIEAVVRHFNVDVQLVTDTASPTSTTSKDTGLPWGTPELSSDEEAPELYVWIAGESGMVTSLRRYLTKDIGIPRNAIAFMGYWKLGVAIQS